MKMNRVLRAVSTALGVVFALSAVVSCKQDIADPDDVAMLVSQPLSFSVLEEDMEPLTRTVLTASDIETKKTCITLAAYRSGTLYAAKHFTSSLSSMSMPLEVGTYTVYALVNMGDMSSTLKSSYTSESSLSSLTYTVPSYNSGSTSVATMGMPMAGSTTKTISSSTTGTQSIPVSRLLSKVTVNLSCDWTGAKITSAKVCNLNKTLKPFGTSAAQGSSDILGFEDITTVASGSQGSTLSTVLYVPENMQGVVSGVQNSSDKRPDGGNATISGKQARLTYLQVAVTCSGSGAPYTGSVTYRSYLGNNATTNFDLARNTHYIWTIAYHESGLQTNNWKIATDLTDERWMYLDNPIWVERGDEVDWWDVLSCSANIGDLNFAFTNGNATVSSVIYDYDNYPSGSFTIDDNAPIGKYVNLQVKPTVNPTSDLTKNSQVRVVDKVVEWIDYDSSIYSQEGKKVYAVNPGSSVDADVDFSFMWEGSKTHERGLGGSSWSYTSAPATGISSSLTDGNGNTPDKVSYSVANTVAPGDYSIVVSRTGYHSGSDQAYLRVNDTRYLRWIDRSSNLTSNYIADYVFTSESEVHTYVNYGSYYTIAGRSMSSQSNNPFYFNFGDITGERKIRNTTVTSSNYASYLVLDYDTQNFSMATPTIGNSNTVLVFTTRNDLASGVYEFKVRFVGESAGSGHEVVSYLHVTDVVSYILRIVPSTAEVDSEGTYQLAAHLNKVTNGVEDPSDYIDVTSDCTWGAYSGGSYGSIDPYGLFTAATNNSSTARTYTATASCTYDGTSYSTSTSGQRCVITINGIQKMATIEPQTSSIWPGDHVQLVAYYDEFRNGTRYVHTQKTATWSLQYPSDANYINLNASTGYVVGIAPGNNNYVNAEFDHQGVHYVTGSGQRATVNVLAPTYVHNYVMELGDGTYSNAGTTPANATVAVYGEQYFQIHDYWQEYRDGSTPYDTGETILGRYTGSWTSEDTSVATMSYGRATGVAYGTAGIAWTYTTGGTTYTLNTANGNGGSLTVQSVSNYLEVTPANTTATAGQTVSLVAKYHTVTNGVDDGGVVVTTNSGTSWSRYSGSSQVSVNNSGNTKGQVTCPASVTSAQTATVRASYNGYTADANVTFNPDISYVLVANPTSISVVAGSTVNISADVYRVVGGVREGSPYATGVTVSSWSSSATSVATVTNAGVVTGVSAGTAWMSATATYSGQQLTTTGNDRCQVTVTQVTNYKLVLTPNPGSLEVSCYGTYQVWRQVGDDASTRTLIPNTDVTWQTGNSSIATIVGSGTNAGRATGVSVGSVTITVTLKSSAQYYSQYTTSGRTATATLNVISSGGWSDGWDNPGSEIIMGN